MNIEKFTCKTELDFAQFQKWAVNRLWLVFLWIYGQVYCSTRALDNFMSVTNNNYTARVTQYIVKVRYITISSHYNLLNIIYSHHCHRDYYDFTVGFENAEDVVAHLIYTHATHTHTFRRQTVLCLLFFCFNVYTFMYYIFVDGSHRCKSYKTRARQCFPVHVYTRVIYIWFGVSRYLNAVWRRRRRRYKTRHAGRDENTSYYHINRRFTSSHPAGCCARGTHTYNIITLYLYE